MLSHLEEMSAKWMYTTFGDDSGFSFLMVGHKTHQIHPREIMPHTSVG